MEYSKLSDAQKKVVENFIDKVIDANEAYRAFLSPLPEFDEDDDETPLSEHELGLRYATAMDEIQRELIEVLCSRAE